MIAFAIRKNGRILNSVLCSKIFFLRMINKKPMLEASHKKLIVIFEMRARVIAEMELLLCRSIDITRWKREKFSVVQIIETKK
jgi:hypothetical protein